VRLAAILAVTLSAGATTAEPLVDYVQLYAQHPDKVVVKENGGVIYRQLTLGDGVVTRCKGAAGYDDCLSIDTNDRGGTTDCTLAHTARTLLLTRSCKIGGAGQIFMLEKVMNELGEHVARNAVPPRDWPALRELVMQRAQDNMLPACEDIDSQGRDSIAYRLRMDKLQKLQDLTATPRLPVGKCLD